MSPIDGFAAIGRVLYEMDDAATVMGIAWSSGYREFGRADPDGKEAGRDRIVI